MKISGLQKLTLLDFPGKVACTVFLNGCNFRCPYCHNSELLEGNVEPVMTVEELLAFLQKRRGILEGVCITGGEPTLHPQLFDLLEAVKDLGYAVKLDTNGYRPEVLRSVIQRGLADYVAMDIKNGPMLYGQTVGLESPDLSKIEESIRILLENKVDYEFRTTVVLPLHSAASMTDMALWLQHLGNGRKAKRLFLQPFVDRDTVPVAGLSAPDEKMLAEFEEILASCTEQIGVRGVK